MASRQRMPARKNKGMGRQPARAGTPALKQQKAAPVPVQPTNAGPVIVAGVVTVAPTTAPPTQHAPAPLAAGTAPLPPPIGMFTLAQYIEENDKLLAVLGVFVVLTGFSGTLSKAVGFNLVLTSIFLLMTILIAIEAQARLRQKKGATSFRLDLFKWGFTASVFLLVIYEAMFAYPLYNTPPLLKVIVDCIVGLGTPIFLIISVYFIAPPIRRLILYVRGVTRDSTNKKSKIYLRAITLTYLLLVALSFTEIDSLMAPLQPHISHGLDKVYVLLIGSKPR